MTFGHRLTELRENSGFHTRKSFAEKIGIPETTLRNYETDAREPGHTFLKQMSDFFKVSTDYLLGLTEEKERLSTHQLKESEYIHIEKYRNLDTRGQKVVDTVIEWETERIKEIKYLKEQISGQESAHAQDIIPLKEEPIIHIANAAHKRTDIPESELTPEMQQADEEIMNDENF